MTSTQERASTPVQHHDGEAAQRPPRPLAGIVAALVVAVLAGLAYGRFAFSPPTAAPGPAPARAVTLADTLAGLEAAVEADPQDLEAWQQLGIAATQRAIAVGDPAYYDQATRAFDRADALSPDEPDTLLGRGKLTLSLHQFSDALALGERAVAARPANGPSLGVLVDAQVELGRYEEAAETLQRMLDARPDLQALARASYLRELSGDLDGAALAMRQAEAASAGTGTAAATVAALLGDLELRRGRVADAGAAYDRALAQDPELPGALAGRARVLVATGRADEALEVLEGAVDRLPVTPVVLLWAQLLRLDGDEAAADDADQVVRAIAELQRGAGQVVDLEMARFEADRGDPALALELAERAYAIRPDNVFAADALAWARYRSGDVEGAAALLDGALRLGGADAAALVRAATITDAAGDPAGARDLITEAFAEAPWTALVERAAAVELGERLEVDAPAVWTDDPLAG